MKLRLKQYASRVLELRKRHKTSDECVYAIIIRKQKQANNKIYQSKQKRNPTLPFKRSVVNMGSYVNLFITMNSIKAFILHPSIRKV